MISRLHRFHGHGSLRHVYQHGHVVRGPLCAVKYVRNSRRQTYRLAVVVSKKVSKSAVLRNRIRRRIYEVVRQYEPFLQDSYDIVITVFSEQLATLPAPQLQQQLHDQLQQAGLLANIADTPHGKI
jgi:ribonuclease P protein component